MKPATALCALLLLAACQRERGERPITASGHVEATRIRLSSRVAGRIASFGREEGDRLAAGDLLAEIDPTDLELLLAQVRAERAQAEAEWRLRESGSRREDIAELEARTRVTAADLEGARLDFERAAGLHREGVAAAKLRDDARARRDGLAARLEAERRALERARNGFRDEEKAASRARVEGLAARQAQVEQQISDCRILSPAAGVLSERIAEPGEMVAAGAPLAVLTDLDRPWLNVWVAEPDLARIRIGSEAEVTTDDGQKRRGRVRFIASQAEFTPRNVQTRDERVKLVFRVKVGLDNADGLFKPGLPAEARFLAPEPAR